MSDNLNESEAHNMPLKEMLHSLKKKFLSGDLDRYSYISEKHEFNKILLEYASQIKNSQIESIKILPDVVIFTFKPLGIELETDGAARSAPFEILNFGSYEPEDEALAYNLIQDGNSILDVGANIGWFAVNFGKRFPNSKIYSFEPIPPTFQFLERNILRNKIKNTTVLNFGLSNKDEERFFYYFKGGSAIASIENLIDHKSAQKVKCQLRTLDTVMKEIGMNTVDFIKCDIEGSELFMLQGSEKTIQQFQPVLFIELCEEWCQKCGYKSKDVTDLLKLWGYECYEASHNKLKKLDSIRKEDNGRYNYFFLNREKHKNLISQFS